MMVAVSRKMVRNKTGEKNLRMMGVKGYGSKFGLHFVGSG